MPYLVHRNCRHFRGELPCKPHKIDGVICDGCPVYDPTDERILIIKLAAAGDVIRTTPLLRKLRAEHPRAWITWLTETPDVVPTRARFLDGADEVLKWGHDATLICEETPWDWVIVLDKDRPACALAGRTAARRRSGYILEHGRPAPVNAAAEPKFITGIDDKMNRANTLCIPPKSSASATSNGRARNTCWIPASTSRCPQACPKNGRSSASTPAARPAGAAASGRKRTGPNWPRC